MNIFEKTSDIYGNYSLEKMQQITKNFLDAAKSVRNKLGNRAYELDQYLNMIFEVISCTDGFDAMSDGSSFFSELRALCQGFHTEKNILCWRFTVCCLFRSLLTMR